MASSNSSVRVWVAICKFLSISCGVAILLDCSCVIWPSSFLHLLATVPRLASGIDGVEAARLGGLLPNSEGHSQRSA